MLTKLVATRVVRWLGAGLASASMLAWIAERSGPAEVEVIVHVTVPEVEVSVAGRVFRVPDRTGPPLVCELPPGRYELITRRGGRVLQREAFEARRGESAVLNARDATAE